MGIVADVRTPLDRRDAVAVAVLALIGVGIPISLAAAGGAIGIPAIDDWVYFRGAASFFQTGIVDMPSHTAASVGQLLLVQPLLWLSGGDPWAFTAFGLVATVVANVATYLLARRFVDFASAVMVVLLVQAFPGFAREAASFMTDIPAFALISTCLFLGVRWLQGDGHRAGLLASVAVGILGVSVREFALAGPAAILIVAWARNRPADRVFLAGVSALFISGVGWTILVASSVAGYAAAPAPLDPGRTALVGPALATLALVLLPATTLTMSRRLASLSAHQLLIAVGLGCFLVIPSIAPLGGNLWFPAGLAGDALLAGTRNAVIGAAQWALTRQFALIALILIVALGLGWLQHNVPRVPSTLSKWGIQVLNAPEAPLVVFMIIFVAEIVAFAWVGTIIDRYMYPMVPPAAILLLRAAGPARIGRSLAMSHAALAGLALSAIVIAANSFAYDGARWRAGLAAVASGYDPRTVDAGYEWVGFNAVGRQEPYSGEFDLTWYQHYWASFRPCIVFSNSPLSEDWLNLISIDRSAYRQLLLFGSAEPLYKYGTTVSGCPPATSTRLLRWSETR